MRLSKTQTLFADTMLSPVEAVENPATTLIELFATPKAILPERLKIYRNNIIGSLTNVLQATYPLIVKLTGEDFVASLMRAFILENPPLEACLHGYGSDLAAFIETFTPAESLPYLPDVARLEWAMNKAYYAIDDAPLTSAALQNTPLDELADMVLSLRSSVRLLDSNWPLINIRDFCLKENRDESETLDLNQGGCRIMVYRPALAVDIVPLGPAEYAFLQDISAGNTLGNSLETTLQNTPDFDFQGFLQKHLALETFSTPTTNI